MTSGARQLILASGSPRRRALLGALGLAFTVEAADVDETALPGEAPDALVCRLSQTKSLAVAARYPDAAVLAADTVVVLDGHILGKPAGPGDAVRMLASLRGRMHQVYTAVSLAARAEVHGDCCCSHVWMRNYGDDEIRTYVATGDPLDKAGSYGIQHPAFSPVERWDGCYASIMGLPLGMAARMLAAAGLQLRQEQIPAVCERASGAAHCCLRRFPPG